MLPTYTAEQLTAFEKRIERAFLKGEIRAPIHLSGGNEDQLIRYFKNVSPSDWVFTTWRSHYHCLLKGVPEDELYADIISGRSMYLNYPEYRIVASSIMGGILPIALGVALGVHRDMMVLKPPLPRIHVFVGDMAAMSGVYHEVVNYARWHEIPMSFVVEDNGLSTNTPTGEVWGYPLANTHDFSVSHYYKYERVWPHTGVGQWVTFG